jgi:sporulation protein YlmC with PRC-barrel domain
VVEVSLDLVYEVLDLQVLDVNGRRCGRVDDIEVDLKEERVTALLVGSGTWPARLPGHLLPRVARKFTGEVILGKNVIRIPWELIDSIGATVNLKRPAEDLNLGRGDFALAPVMTRLLMIPERKPR